MNKNYNFHFSFCLENAIRNTIIATFIILYFILDPHRFGYTHTSQLYTHITYIFAHANILHLAGNIFAFYLTWQILLRLNITKESVITAFFAAIIASFISINSQFSFPLSRGQGDVIYSQLTNTPTVGASGLIYAMIAAPIAGILAKRLKITNKKQFIKAYAGIAIATAIQLLIPSINTTTHIAAFTTNILLLFIYYNIRNNSCIRG